jgi:hypothetical protein
VIPGVAYQPEQQRVLEKANSDISIVNQSDAPVSQIYLF